MDEKFLLVSVGHISLLEDTFKSSVLLAKRSLPLNGAMTAETSGVATSPAQEAPSDGDSDLVIAVVGQVGTEFENIARILQARFRQAGYRWEEVRVSRDVLAHASPFTGTSELDRLQHYMGVGDKIREQDTEGVAKGVAGVIRQRRGSNAGHRTVVFINSLKHPQEVAFLRRLYAGGFYLIAVQVDDKRRRTVLQRDLIGGEALEELMVRDEADSRSNGQQVRETFHLADFFVRMGNDVAATEGHLNRFVDILFGSPYRTPTFDEYAMFLAFASALRSADLSRQVGAVLARRETVLATGANDVPRARGGLYWPQWDDSRKDYVDAAGGRDHTLGGDSNRFEQNEMIERIVRDGVAMDLDPDRLRRVLDKGPIRDLTEYGRIVHAEMEALSSCARTGVSTVDSTLYSTTFPCHNCAKHIIAAGIRRVVFIEPYPKSKAVQFHSDAIVVGYADEHLSDARVLFEPFAGLGPRRFFDLFSMKWGVGRTLRRKYDQGDTVSWSASTGELRIQMRRGSYVDREADAERSFEATLRALRK